MIGERTKNKCLTFLKCKKIKGGKEEQRILIDKVLHLLSVGKSDPGLKRCGVVFGRFDTRRVEEEAVLFGIANVFVFVFWWYPGTRVMMFKKN